MAKLNIIKGKTFSTKSGKSVEIIYTQRNSKNFPIIGLVNGVNVLFFTENGKFYKDKDSDNDLK